jgi:hypothetical protein
MNFVPCKLKEQLHNLYFVPNITNVIKSRMMRWVQYVAYMGEMKHWYKISVGTPERKRAHGKSKCRWENNIKMDLNGIRCRVWKGFIWLRNGVQWWAFMNMLMNIQVP